MAGPSGMRHFATCQPEEKLQAAVLANRWGWHSRAIAAAASLGEYDDLSIRYPLPYQTTFEQFSLQASIPPTWAYGIARSESLFMRDVRSRAGAIGLMQLMPATGRDVARDIKLPYTGLATLVDPESNIRSGYHLPGPDGRALWRQPGTRDSRLQRGPPPGGRMATQSRQH